jgi:AAHS family benzoate transporter-like MFS transporter
MPKVIINPTTAKNMINNSKLSLFHFTVFILCLSATMGEGYNIFLYGAVLPLLTKEWSLSSVQAGIIGSYGLIGMMLGSVIFGWVADKVGRKSVIIICVTLYSLFTVLCGFAASPVSFSWLRFLAGLGIGGVLPNVIALTTDYSPKALQNTMVAIMLCGMQFGGILGPAISMATMNKFSWHAVLWMGGIPLLLLPFMLKLLPESLTFLIHKEKTEHVRKVLSLLQSDIDLNEIVVIDEHRIEEKPRLISLFRSGFARNTTMFCIAYFMSLLMIYGLGTWLPELMIRTGYDLNASLIFPIVLNVGCILGTFLFAIIADKWLGAKKLVVILFLIAAASLILLGFKYHVMVLYTLIFITGACTYGTQNIANAFVSQYYSSHIRSTGLGLCNGIGRLGAIFGTAFWGILLQWNLSVQADFLIFAFPSFIASLAFFVAKDNYSGQPVNKDFMKLNNT